MLLEAFPSYNKNMQELLARRVEYLRARAEAVRYRGENSSIPHWQSLVIEATLWLEASESAVAIGHYADAQSHLRAGARALLAAGLPSGAAMLRILVSYHQEFDAEIEEVLQPWRERQIPETTYSEPHRERDGSSLASAARETSQQWAYFVLAEAGSATKYKDSKPRRIDPRDSVAAAPVGRLRLPLRDYIAVVARWNAAHLDREPNAHMDRAIDEMLASSIGRLYRSLEETCTNAYLWDRMLAPVPMFDIDVAMLITATENSRKLTDSTALSKAIAGRLSGGGVQFADEFIRAVERLKRGE